MTREIRSIDDLTPDAKNNTALDRTLTRISPLIDN